MKVIKKNNYALLLLINLLLVASIGVLMRYKIGFSFPYLNQKNLQHAHSHFAFAGWISQSLLVMFVYYLQQQNIIGKIKQFNAILWLNLLIAYGMLVSFAFSGFSFASIILSSASIILFFVFAFLANKELQKCQHLPATNFFRGAFLFGVLSSIGTISLSIIFATHQFNQHIYLASVYWYLHFQYNGYFFFSCLGLLFYYLSTLQITVSKWVLKLLFLSTFFTYGLSVLWLKLPWYIYLIIFCATIAQTIGFAKLLIELYNHNFLKKIKSVLVKYLIVFVAIALIIKHLLQLGSTIPNLSHFAFGFRSVVIAYLHLVLLAIISVSIICFLVVNGFIIENKKSRLAILLFCLGIFLNELVLGIQGIASITYALIPFANEALFAISIFMFFCVVWLIIIHKKRKA
jgi:hypothetical protein